jgi:N-acetylglucosaminyldiphosphoundecaprenol N-acetyl-beta-D-mannosaminyltransferase
MKSEESIDVLGVKISAVNLDFACQTIGQWIDFKQKTYVCVAPVSTIIDCQKDPQYRAIINNAGMTTPDGMPLVWLGKMRGEKAIARTYGPDLMLNLCNFSQQRGYKHYFYGGTLNTIECLSQRLKMKFPQLNIVGSFAPGLLKSGELEKEEVIAKINDASPDIVWVGLGSPKQDYWMHLHRSRLNAPVIIGIGAAFDFVAGIKPQAPRWMQRSGLEWLFRLMCEPRRLWKRYLLGNTQFIYLLIKESLQGKGRVKNYAAH